MLVLAKHFAVPKGSETVCYGYWNFSSCECPVWSCLCGGLRGIVVTQRFCDNVSWLGVTTKIRGEGAKRKILLTEVSIYRRTYLTKQQSNRTWAWYDYDMFAITFHKFLFFLGKLIAGIWRGRMSHGAGGGGGIGGRWGGGFTSRGFTGENQAWTRTELPVFV